MAKNSDKARDTVKVVLQCIYSDGEHNPGPGSVIELDADEADRLIGLGAATAYEPPAESAAE